MSGRHLRTNAITDGDDTIALALEVLSVPALIASVVFMTGDGSFLRGPIRPREFIQNEFQGKLTVDEQSTLRRDALAAIVAWRDAGCPAPPPLEDALAREVMDWIACEPVPDDYVRMYLDELDLNGSGPRQIRPAPGSDPEQLSTLIIGCGMSGLLAAIRLQEAGLPFEVVDQRDGPGGTWLSNTYPGARVDVASHFYCYSFEPNTAFTEYYARQPELGRYFEDLLGQHGLTEHVQWRTEVERAVWDEDAGRWAVTLRSPDGSITERSVNVLISGVGILSRPLIPDLPGLAHFAGPAFHSAEWDHSVDLRGKRVALIGAGASGFQIGPAIVDDVESLLVLQRTPQWMAPNSRYHQPVKDGEHWAFTHLPGYGRWIRFMLMWQSSDKLLEMVRMQPDWPDFPRTANAMSAARREVFVAWIEQQAGDDAELARKATPTYPPMSKRMLQDDGSWLRCLRRPHVTLVTDEITAIDATSVTAGGERFEIDVIVLATGFRASEVLQPMEIVGRGGVALADVWDGKPAAYLGVSVPDFPNFFMLGGPGTGLAHAGSVIFTTECQMRYVGEALRTLIDGAHQTIEPTHAAHDRYRDALQAEVATLMWGHPSIEHSWYKAADGGVYVLCPWRSVDYWQMTLTLRAEEHVIA